MRTKTMTRNVRGHAARALAGDSAYPFAMLRLRMAVTFLRTVVTIRGPVVSSDPMRRGLRAATGSPAAIPDP